MVAQWLMLFAVKGGDKRSESNPKDHKWWKEGTSFHNLVSDLHMYIVHKSLWHRYVEVHTKQINRSYKSMLEQFASFDTIEFSLYLYFQINNWLA